MARAETISVNAAANYSRATALVYTVSIAGEYQFHYSSGHWQHPIGGGNNEFIEYCINDGSTLNGTDFAIQANAGDVFKFYVGYPDGATNSAGTVVYNVTSPTPVGHTLTVTNGTGSGTYTLSTVVSVSATVPQGKRFVAWTGDTTYLSANTANANFTMPNVNCAITATFEDIPTHYLNVAGGITSGNYPNLATVDISPTIPAGCHFVKWQPVDQLTQADTVANNVLVMPDSDYTITAVFGEGEPSSDGEIYHVWVDNFSELNSIVTVPIVNKLSEIKAELVSSNEKLEDIKKTLTDIKDILNMDTSDGTTAATAPSVPPLAMNIPTVSKNDMDPVESPEKLHQIAVIKDSLNRVKDSLVTGGGTPPPLTLHMNDSVVQDSFTIDFSTEPLNSIRVSLRNAMSLVCAFLSMIVFCKVFFTGVANI